MTAGGVGSAAADGVMGILPSGRQIAKTARIAMGGALLFGRLKNRILAGFAVFWLRRARYRWSRLRRRLVERRYRNVSLPAVTSLGDIRSALEQVTWTADGLVHLYDAVSYPGYTWARKRDDCDGFAALASELLTRLDSRYTPVLVTAVVFPLKRAHTVCVFHALDDNTVRVFDNARLLDQRFPSIKAVADYVATRGHAAICWDMVRPSDLHVIEFHRFPPSGTAPTPA